MMQLVTLNNLEMWLLRSFVPNLVMDTNYLAYIQSHYFTMLIMLGEYLRSTRLLKFRTPDMHTKGLFLVKYAHHIIVHLGYLIIERFDSTEEQTTCVSAADGPSSPKLLGLG